MNKKLLIYIGSTLSMVVATGFAQAQIPSGISTNDLQLMGGYPPGASYRSQTMQAHPAEPDKPSKGASAPTSPHAPEPLNRVIDPTVFGGDLFKGHFAAEFFSGYNENYLLAVGDRVEIKLWGAIEAMLVLPVDEQGNIFIPQVGPIRVAGVSAGRLNDYLSKKIESIYKSSISVYANVASAEPVKVFVTGAVQAPGLYGAYASDSLLHFIDRAGGIDPALGSYIKTHVVRAGERVKEFNLYRFLLNGTLPLFQFRDGDSIVVSRKQSTTRVSGLVYRPALYEFADETTLGEVLAMAGVMDVATHVRVIRHQAETREALYKRLDKEALAYAIRSGDEIHIVQDREVADIVVAVDGEYRGESQFVLPYESSLADALVEVDLTQLSNLGGAQLFRTSIAQRQREVLDEMLQKLEKAVLSARSGTREEAELRAREADLIMRFIERARDVEPSGQLILHHGYDIEKVYLEDKDRIVIPRVSNIVAVQGEVFFPSAFIHRPGDSVQDYLKRAGGLSHNGSRDNVFLRRPNGEFVEVKEGLFRRYEVRPGDEILVLPRVDTKRFQFSKDLVQIIYQIALSAGVVLRI